MYHIVAAGRTLQAYPSLLENLDLLYKFFWVFDKKYTPAVQLFYRFLESFVYKQANGRMPCSVSELVSVLCSNKNESNDS
jgi:hypothetical protein